MEEEQLEDLENEEQRNIRTYDDNAWQLRTVSEEAFQRWKTEKERYDEVIEYIREVDEILNLIKPFPRDEPKAVETTRQDLVRPDSQPTKFGLDYLETIIKLVDQLKELQENKARMNERNCYLRDLKSLREHKRRLKYEEFEMRSRTRGRVCSDNSQDEMIELSATFKNRRSKSASSENDSKPKDNWQDKRKSLCLPHGVSIHESKSKVSKWTKVKEAFHWERASHSMVSKPKKELYLLQLPGEVAKRAAETSSVESDCGRDHSPDGSSVSGLDGFLPPPPPPPPPLRVHPSLPSRSEGLLSLQPPPDIPSSSSSDKLDEFVSSSEVINKGPKTSDPESPSRLYATDDNDDVETSPRKSFSEEMILGQIPQHLCKDEFASSRLTKSNKTTWGKVKDIIQTRKDSLKKKPKKSQRGTEEMKKRREPPSPSGSLVSDLFEDLPTPEEKIKNVVESFSTKIISESSEETSLISQQGIDEKCSRKLMPVLTITLPSTEELRNLSSDELERRDGLEDDKSNVLVSLPSQVLSSEDKTKFGKGKSSHNQGLSKWVKVKRVFLTSTGPSRPIQYVPATSSSPTCHSKTSGFFSDFESDEVSSGEWIDDKPNTQDKSRIGENESQAALTLIQEDIRKSYNELQKKLRHEFDQKLREWEIKNEPPPKPEDPAPPKPKKEDGDTIPKLRKTRDSITVPLPSINDLSPEFKKKLNDWKKMKTSQSTSAVPSSGSKDEGQNIKIKIGEWQPWKARGSQKHSQSPESKSPSSRPPSNYRKDEEGVVGGSSGRRDSKRRESVKKNCHSRTPSGTESISGNSMEKDGRFSRRTQKMKDLQWVEKELQKIEREKVRLEQEREKYLEREARLEQMRRTIGTTLPTQEILVRTPAGFFRFKGISQKFTKKLYEWEKARGIAPEASTFALLEESVKTTASGNPEFESGMGLQRSKSMGSVPELSSALIIQSMANHPSSLSLNDVDELKSLEDDADGLDDSVSSEHLKEGLNENAEPEAIIVDVEDVEEETAVLADTPTYKSEVPVYTYTPEEVSRLMDSSERFSFSSDNRFDVHIVEEKETLGRLAERSMEYHQSHFEVGGRKPTRRLESTETKTEMIDLDIIKGENDMMSDDKMSEVEDDLKKTPPRITKRHLSPTVLPSSFNSITNEEVLQTHREETTDICGGTELRLATHGLNKSTKVKNFLKWSSSGSDSEGTRVQSSKFSSYSRRSEESHILSKRTQSQSKSYSDSAEESSLQIKNDHEVLKKKIKEKISMMQRLSSEPKQYSRTLGEYSCRLDQTEEGTEVYKNTRGRESHGISESVGPVNVFVRTSRKIISPVQTNSGTSPAVYSYVIDDVKLEENQEKQEEVRITSVRKNSKSLSPHRRSEKSVSPVPVYPRDSKETPTKLENEIKIEKRDIGMPPLPNSPKSVKKISSKEAAPSIRMIIAKYNQKISEHESIGEKGGENTSPWKSPVFGKRIIRKDDGSWKTEVKKSASFDNMRSMPDSSSTPNEQIPQIKGILKSSSVGVMKYQNPEPTVSHLSIPETKPSLSDSGKENSTSPSVLRALRIQKAKEDFLSGRTDNPKPPSSVQVPEVKPEPQNQSSEDSSISKSVSAETITTEKTTEQTNVQEKATEGRAVHKSSSKFDISSIKSKFRKIRMRKEKEKPNAVAALCRQSLLIEVPGTWDKNPSNPNMSKSCPSSPVMNRTKDEKSNDSTSGKTGDKK